MDQSPILRVIDIVDGTSVDGPGLRTSIYFAGCDHRCPGCHNPSTWDFRAGYEITVDQLMRRIIDNDFNVTFSGGDPLYQLQPLTALARAVKAAGKTIWCYTGFIYEDLLADKKYSELLSLIDVLVDGPFIMS
ncbi:MAG: radical SAM protein, partial [Muribaculaceae bacterium]|nr:radical SAM protein [Muribaculaceae bacterium]